MKYKVGDKVKLKSKEGLYELKQQHENLYIPPVLYEKAGSACTIRSIYDGFYSFEEMPAFWAELLIEGLVEEENKVGTALNPIEPKSNANCLTPEVIEGLAEEPVLSAPNITEVFFIHEKDMKKTTEYILPEGYIFKDENGNIINATKIVLEKKKKEYPKTYEECCKVLDFCGDYFLTTYDADCMVKKEVYGLLQQVNSLTRLLICKSAYWKIAGEEMGLGKPWEPDWRNSDQEKFIIRMYNGYRSFWHAKYLHSVLAFPTAEMRDAFYDNFKEEIEMCKELL